MFYTQSERISNDAVESTCNQRQNEPMADRIEIPCHQNSRVCDVDMLPVEINDFVNNETHDVIDMNVSNNFRRCTKKLNQTLKVYFFIFII